MTVSGRRSWSVLSNMSWEELETRVRQEVSKRLDVTLSRIGLKPARNGASNLRASREVFLFHK